MRQVSEEIEAYRRKRTCGDPLRLENFGYRVYSQSDEDGIIAEIFRRIGATNRKFVEFGCETGLENNTRLLLEQGWRGLWIEALPEYARQVRAKARMALKNGCLKFIEAAVTRENINGLLQQAEVTGEIDLLSIDIDGNDYHVFDAINVIGPRVIVLEHNHCYPPLNDSAGWIMPYDPSYRWGGVKADYGASLRALSTLAAAKGYALVGCGLYSANGFYVRDDLVADRFSGPFAPERLWNPLNYEMVLKFPKREADASLSGVNALLIDKLRGLGSRLSHPLSGR